jgi:peptidoglycan/LPS O-acetylase OafA/YrhL
MEKSAAPQAQASARAYVASLDGYRAFGTLVVLMHHLPFIFLRTPFAYGWWVLQSFFVMSGFLLTMILLKEKEKGYPFGQYIKSFYLKRFYRIFPLYWAFLAFFGLLLLAFGVTKIPLFSGLMEEYKQNWAFLWTYTYNFKELINFKQGLNPNLSPFFSHLWSLSVEEQYYLMLPFMVFFLNREHLKMLVLGIIIASPLLRLATYLYFDQLAYQPQHAGYFNNDDFLKDSWVAVIILRSTWCQLDCLAFGMALALWDFKWIPSPKKAFWWLFLFFVAVVTINGIYTASKTDIHHLKELAILNPMLRKSLEIFPTAFLKFYVAVSEHINLIQNYQFVYMYTVVNSLSFLIVLSCIRNEPILNFFKREGMIYSGKITYGAYVFHYPLLMFIILGTLPLINKVQKLSFKATNLILGDYAGVVSSQLASEIFMLLIYLPLLYLLSHLSFKYFEMYFINLKAKVK